MKTRARLAAGALTTMALLGGTVTACSGDAPETVQDEEDSGADEPNESGGESGEDDEEGEGGG